MYPSLDKVGVGPHKSEWTNSIHTVVYYEKQGMIAYAINQIDKLHKMKVHFY